jgi:hypothetical protein
MINSIRWGVVCLFAAYSAGAAAQAVYNFNSTVEGWTAVGTNEGMDDFRHENGALRFDYVTPGTVFDPQIVSPAGLELDSSLHHWLRIDVEITTPGAAGPQTFQVFYDDGDADGFENFNEPDARLFTVTPNSGVQTIIFDMAPVPGGRDAFDGTVVRFRIDPGTSEADLVGGSAAIHLIALTNDADFDHIPDDTEIAIFGDITTADQTTDTDGDGLLDWLEIALGLDPLVDEGATLPVGGAGILVGALGLAGYVFVRRRKSN